MKQILATKELKVIIDGVEYECLLIPPSEVVDIDYRNCPEKDPRVQALIKKVKEEYGCDDK